MLDREVCGYGHPQLHKQLKASPLSPLQDVWVKLIRQEGLFALWKGFTPYYFRLGPHTVITFIFLEQLQQAARRFYGSDSRL